ncbi:MAG: hypothetical protein F4Y68_03545 [Boseongicola sp. SB0665_bin_10]|nr:hypothetical protein [Boseongicola sp. SB0665_bin_10]
MISVVMPDSGPLISLALAGRLDLLDRFNSQILITDVVKIELLEAPFQTPDQEAISKWIDSRGNRIRVVETVSGGLMRKTLELLDYVPEEERRRHYREIRIRDVGESSIRDLADEIRGGLTRDSTGLVLFEDRRVMKMDFGPHVRRMSTWSFALALEAMQVIPSAEGMFNQIGRAGRSAGRLAFDRKGAEAKEDFAGSYDLSGLDAPDRPDQHGISTEDNESDNASAEWLKGSESDN